MNAFSIIFILFPLFVFCQTDEANKCRCNPKIDTTSFTVEKLPEFIGGESALMVFVKGKKLLNNSVNGRVFISFIINCKGEACGFKSEKVEGNIQQMDIDKIIRYLETMPRWKPAKIKGKSVDMNYMCPITIVKGKT
jgi:hypothetical protein